MHVLHVLIVSLGNHIFRKGKASKTCNIRFACLPPLLMVRLADLAAILPIATLGISRPMLPDQLGRGGLVDDRRSRHPEPFEVNTVHVRLPWIGPRKSA